MKEKVFSVAIGGQGHDLTRKNTISYLFRHPDHQDFDYLQIINDKQEVLVNVFRNPELCRLMAGIAFKATGSPYRPKFNNRDSFADRYGWFADAIIQDTAPADTIDDWVAVEVAKDLHEDGSWELDDDD